MLDDNELFALAIEKKGSDNQTSQCIEELNELAVVLNHARRPEKETTLYEIMKEVVDAELGIAEMKFMHKLPEDQLRNIRILAKEKLEVELLSMKGGTTNGTKS